MLLLAIVLALCHQIVQGSRVQVRNARRKRVINPGHGVSGRRENGKDGQGQTCFTAQPCVKANEPTDYTNDVLGMGSEVVTMLAMDGFMSMVGGDPNENTGTRRAGTRGRLPKVGGLAQGMAFTRMMAGPASYAVGPVTNFGLSQVLSMSEIGGPASDPMASYMEADMCFDEMFKAVEAGFDCMANMIHKLEAKLYEVEAHLLDQMALLEAELRLEELVEAWAPMESLSEILDMCVDMHEDGSWANGVGTSTYCQPSLDTLLMMKVATDDLERIGEYLATHVNPSEHLRISTAGGGDWIRQSISAEMVFAYIEGVTMMLETAAKHKVFTMHRDGLDGWGVCAGGVVNNQCMGGVRNEFSDAFMKMMYHGIEVVETLVEGPTQTLLDKYRGYLQTTVTGLKNSQMQFRNMQINGRTHNQRFDWDFIPYAPISHAKLNYNNVSWKHKDTPSHLSAHVFKLKESVGDTLVGDLGQLNLCFEMCDMHVSCQGFGLNEDGECVLYGIAPYGAVPSFRGECSGLESGDKRAPNFKHHKQGDFLFGDCAKVIRELKAQKGYYPQAYSYNQAGAWYGENRQNKPNSAMRPPNNHVFSLPTVDMDIQCRIYPPAGWTMNLDEHSNGQCKEAQSVCQFKQDLKEVTGGIYGDTFKWDTEAAAGYSKTDQMPEIIMGTHDMPTSSSHTGTINGMFKTWSKSWKNMRCWTDVDKVWGEQANGIYNGITHPTTVYRRVQGSVWDSFLALEMAVYDSAKMKEQLQQEADMICQDWDGDQCRGEVLTPECAQQWWENAQEKSDEGVSTVQALVVMPDGGCTVGVGRDYTRAVIQAKEACMTATRVSKDCHLIAASAQTPRPVAWDGERVCMDFEPDFCSGLSVNQCEGDLFERCPVSCHSCGWASLFEKKQGLRGYLTAVFLTQYDTKPHDYFPLEDTGAFGWGDWSWEATLFNIPFLQPVFPDGSGLLFTRSGEDHAPWDGPTAYALTNGFRVSSGLDELVCTVDENVMKFTTRTRVKISSTGGYLKVYINGAQMCSQKEESVVDWSRFRNAPIQMGRHGNTLPFPQVPSNLMMERQILSRGNLFERASALNLESGTVTVNNLGDWGSRNLFVSFEWRSLGSDVTPRGSWGYLFSRQSGGGGVSGDGHGPAAYMSDNGYITFRSAGLENRLSCKSNQANSGTWKTIDFVVSNGGMKVEITVWGPNGLERTCTKIWDKEIPANVPAHRIADRKKYLKRWPDVSKFRDLPLKFGGNMRNLKGQIRNIVVQ